MSNKKISLQGRDLLSITNLSRFEIEHIFKIAKDMEIIVNNRTKSQLLSDKILAALFFQPSTRTRLSFTSAMQRLGGTVLGFHNAAASRAGDPNYSESLTDTAIMVSYYADIIVVRHQEASAPYIIAETSDVPVISGGCGSVSAFKAGSSGEHPTQCLLDLYTVYKKRGNLDNLTLLCNGNMTSRAATTLSYSMSIFDNCRVLLNYPKQLELPDDFRNRLDELKVDYKIVDSLEKNIPEADIIYVTSMKNALGLKATPDEYLVDRSKLKGKAKDSCLVMHPLPRTDEIAKDVDDTPYGVYFEEAWNGLPIRMALLAMILGRV